jgi:hypothetical protein
VTKQYPVEGHSRRELQQAHRRGERKHLRDARPDLPEDFIYVIERALSVNPSERYASAGAFEAALARLIGGARRSEAAPARWSALGLSIGIATLVVVAAGTYWLGHRWVGAPPSDPTAASRRSVGVPTVAATTSAAPELTYQIDLGLYRTRGNRQERVRPGERVTLGDQLFVKLRVSVPAYVYIVNEDDQGESYLLFPLPAQSVTNPVPAGTTNRIPGTGGSADVDWQVTSAGGHEHFLIFASPERLAALEQVFAALPRPELGKAMRSARLPEDAIRRLRGVGGLKLTPIFSTPLGEVEETAHGLWVRQLTVDNPVTSR